MDNEIVDLGLLKEFWSRKKSFVRIVIAFALLGFVFAFINPIRFTSSTVIVPQQISDDGQLGNLGGIASLAGIQLNSSSELISPDLYPNIINSTPFKKRLLATELEYAGLDVEITLSEYLEEYYRPDLSDILIDYTVKLPYKVKSWLSNSPEKVGVDRAVSFQTISSSEFQLFQKLEDLIQIEVNSIDGYVTISSKMPNGLLAAEVTDKVTMYLQESVINFKLEKLSQQQIYLEERFEEEKKRYEKLQRELAYYVDSNTLTTTETSRIERKRLEQEVDLSFSVYQNLAEQRESLALKIKETTPIFTIIEPVSVPHRKSEPKRAKTIITFGFIGMFMGLSWVFLKIFYVKFKSIWNKQTKEV